MFAWAIAAFQVNFMQKINNLFCDHKQHVASQAANNISDLNM